MASDNVSAAKMALRDVGNESPSISQDCSDVVHISIFFDGTGNNKDIDEKEAKLSNVARIWRSARIFSDSNINSYPIYVSGVGTPFNGKEFFAGEETKIAVEDSFGGATGAGGNRRLDYGQQQINDALRGALLGKARALGGKVAKHADTGQQQSFADVNKVLGQHRLIKQINVSIFGFSRGAALARAFCNQWLWQCKEGHGKLSYEGYPIRFVFLGLFDTVASFGLPATNSANSLAFGGFKGRDLVVDKRVERCVHQVAAHELRFAFPVDLIRRDGQLPGNWLEKVYPGVHSDIGGGYKPSEQGINDNYARIPMRDMMREALLVGSRILSYQEIKERSFGIFQKQFECKPETEAAYKAYTAVCNPGGSIESQVKKHMEQLYGAYGTLHRAGGENVTQREHRKGNSWSRAAPDDMAKELDNYQQTLKELGGASGAVRALANPAYVIRKGAYAMWIAPEKWQIDAWKRLAGDGAMGFVHTYIHDSKVGFLNNAEPFSYFSKRGISESTRSVQGWFEDNVARPADHAYEATVDAASRGIEKGAEAAKNAREAFAEKAKQAGEAADAALKQGQQAALNAGNAINQATQDAVNGLKSVWQLIAQ